ncbi:hypothetical protein FDP41_013104 [Naegleria fowleri]|uniref:Uncharacterized protein n=1 Tax=Naegleria fowleri TaxID=5763 RepID=A0A6A5C107_NAEFO|nr:uncharacterized protein FDP41_013104 [Naegleria fowleri]KAF0980621.1 hypothetical protein FDP41_013104 [Naegleria fowleri]CAG4711679.1 unnamed protein product [Naegleria fowleri]
MKNQTASSSSSGKTTTTAMSTATSNQAKRQQPPPQQPPTTNAAALSQLFKQFGYYSTCNSHAVRVLLQKHGAISDHQMAQLLGMMAMFKTGLNAPSLDLLEQLENGIAKMKATMATSSSSESSAKSSNNGEDVATDEMTCSSLEDMPAPTTWNLSSFAEVLKERKLKLKWKDIIRRLDYDKLKIQNVKSLELIVKVHKEVVGVKMPISYFLSERWNNQDAQLQLVRLALEGRTSKQSPLNDLIDYNVKNVEILSEFISDHLVQKLREINSPGQH